MDRDLLEFVGTDLMDMFPYLKDLKVDPTMGSFVSNLNFTITREIAGQTNVKLGIAVDDMDEYKPFNFSFEFSDGLVVVVWPDTDDRDDITAKELTDDDWNLMASITNEIAERYMVMKDAVTK